MFGQMIYGIEEEAVETVFKIQAAKPEKFKGVFSDLEQQFVHPETQSFKKPQGEPAVARDPRFGAPSIAASPAGSIDKPAPLSHPKVGRNDPCPCGSGKKYKKCCGK
jgi:preprotein translocase subunit SecA